MIEQTERSPAEVVEFLPLLDEESRTRLLRSAARASYPPGSVIPGGPHGPRVAVVESGLVRIFAQAPGGKQASVGYLHEGEVFGLAEVLARPTSAQVQAVTAASLALLQSSQVAALAVVDFDVSVAINTVLSWRVLHLLQIVAVRSLGTMKQRLAFDLLERACQSQLEGGELTVAATQDDLANSIGSSREVVSRNLARLREAGAVEASRRGIHVLDPMELSAIVRGLKI